MEKYNTRVKVYPDGNFISTTSNRPFFMTPATRSAFRELREKELEESLENCSHAVEYYEKLKDSLYGGGSYRQEYLESIENPPWLEIQEVSSIALSMIDKAKDLGIKCNGVQYFSKEGRTPKKENVRRAKDMIFDLIYLNQFDYFATFTFNPKKTDSFDVSEVMRKVKKWLNNHQHRNNLKYVMIPEYHKSGRIHLHMLYSGNLELVASGKWTKTGKPIYNCKSWSYGFSTVIPCDDNRAKLAFYVSKYVTKDVQRIFGKYYYSSQGLCRECPVEYGNRNFGDIPTESRYVEAIDIRFKYESSIQFNSAEDNTQAILKTLGVIQ